MQVIVSDALRRLFAGVFFAWWDCSLQLVQLG